MTTHYYYLPQRLFLAPRPSNPEDLDFGCTTFMGMKGIGADNVTTEHQPFGDEQFLGGWCTFTTTFKIPGEVIEKIREKLKNQDFGVKPMPNNPTFSNKCFPLATDVATNVLPRLGIVNIIENEVSVESTDFSNGDPNNFFINAKGQGKGSIEAQGLSSFLLTLGPLAAGIFKGALESKSPPGILVTYRLKEQFYVESISVKVTVFFRKFHEAVNTKAGGGSVFGFPLFGLEKAYEEARLNGGVVTQITMGPGSGALTPELNDLVIKRTDAMIDRAYEMAKDKIFDLTPKKDDDPGAGKIGGVAKRLFSGWSVTLKKESQVAEGFESSELSLKGIITLEDAKTTTFDDLRPALESNIEKYFKHFAIDIGRIKSVIASTNVSFSEEVPGRGEIGDAIQSVSMEVGYPSFNEPLDANNNPNLRFLAEGEHVILGNNDPPKKGIAVWNRNNAKEFITIKHQMLEDPLPDWKIDEAMIRKQIVFRDDDKRVDFMGNKTILETKTKVEGAQVVISGEEFGHVFVRFTTRAIPTAMSMELVCKIGSRTDEIPINSENYRNIFWEIYSDKYIDEKFFTYEVKVLVEGPNVTDDPITWQTSAPIKVALPPTKTKTISEEKIVIPDEPPELTNKINEYIKAVATNA